MSAAEPNQDALRLAIAVQRMLYELATTLEQRTLLEVATTVEALRQIVELLVHKLAGVDDEEVAS